MNKEEKLKMQLSCAIDMAESIHGDMVEKFTRDSVPSEIMIQALEITGQLAALEWYLGHIREEVGA